LHQARTACCQQMTAARTLARNRPQAEVSQFQRWIPRQTHERRYLSVPAVTPKWGGKWGGSRAKWGGLREAAPVGPSTQRGPFGTRQRRGKHLRLGERWLALVRPDFREENRGRAENGRPKRRDLALPPRRRAPSSLQPRRPRHCCSLRSTSGRIGRQRRTGPFHSGDAGCAQSATPAPSTLNPICGNARLVVRATGSNALTSENGAIAVLAT
jgi:hypothetical protein